MSKAPKCKVCGVAHWTYEPHVTKIEEVVTEIENNVTLALNNVTHKRGRPRLYNDNASRQRAYRERR